MLWLRIAVKCKTCKTRRRKLEWNRITATPAHQHTSTQAHKHTRTYAFALRRFSSSRTPRRTFHRRHQPGRPWQRRCCRLETPTQTVLLRIPSTSPPTIVCTHGRQQTMHIVSIHVSIRAGTDWLATDGTGQHEPARPPQPPNPPLSL